MEFSRYGPRGGWQSPPPPPPQTSPPTDHQHSGTERCSPTVLSTRPSSYTDLPQSPYTQNPHAHSCPLTRSHRCGDLRDQARQDTSFGENQRQYDTSHEVSYPHPSRDLPIPQTEPEPLSESNSDSGGRHKPKVKWACLRCRKRRIRCSGRPKSGDGACGACRSSRASDSCRFERTQHHAEFELHLPPPHELGNTMLNERPPRGVVRRMYRRGESQYHPHLY